MIGCVKIQREHYGSSFQKRWPLSNLNRTENNLPKHKAKRHRNGYPKQVTENHNRTTVLKRSVINYWGGGGGGGRRNMFTVLTSPLVSEVVQNI